jgi:type I restriction enzyme, S subunit
VDGRVIFFNSTKKVGEKEYQKHKRHLSGKTLLISINGTIGNVAYYKNEEILLGKSVAYLNVGTNFNFDFIFQILQTPTIQQHFISELTGTTIKNLSLKTIRETPLYLPIVTEQQKIASFLTLVDENISKLKEQKALLEQYKKGVMQQLFSQELRFKDENGEDYPDWEEMQHWET